MRDELCDLVLNWRDGFRTKAFGIRVELTLPESLYLLVTKNGDQGFSVFSINKQALHIKQGCLR
jgi:hypothetical protein